MGLTSALNTSLNGLQLNEISIDVLGNNIANAGTNGFKASNVLFTTQLSRTLSVGSAPNTTTRQGGTNPRQVGLGATTAAITKDFTQGGITNSTSPSDLAIQGDGFFILESNNGTVFTRNGNFSLNSLNVLTNAAGFAVQGYGVDDEFQIRPSMGLQNVEIRLGQDTAAQETTEVSLVGALKTSSSAVPGTMGSLFTSAAFTDTASGDPAVDPITLATDLTSMYEDGSATPMFTAGQTITFSAEKGNRNLPAQDFIIGPPVPGVDAVFGETVGDLLTFMQHVLGITTQADDASLPDTQNLDPPQSSGVTLTPDGAIQILGNTGTLNDLQIPPRSFQVDGAEVNLGFVKSASANGESALADFPVFDSLGDRVNVKMTAVLESRTTNTSTYRYYFESPDDSSSNLAIGTGLVVFDGEGNVIEGDSVDLSIAREGTAASTMQFRVSLAGLSGIVAQSDPSTLSLQFQNGSPPGTLINFVIDEAGVINGIYDNGIIRTLGQIALATFPNSQGLVENGGGTYREGVSSGPVSVAAAGSQGTGTIRAGAIELSNTDIGRNLVDLIVASTNYRGNARVISSVQQLVDELLILGR